MARFVSTLGFAKEDAMRIRVSMAVVATVGALLGAQAAQAQTLINPYATTPAAPTTVVEPAQPIDPYAYPYGSGPGAG